VLSICAKFISDGFVVRSSVPLEIYIKYVLNWVVVNQN
jgi:hypothetical protein